MCRKVRVDGGWWNGSPEGVVLVIVVRRRGCA